MTNIVTFNSTPTERAYFEVERPNEDTRNILFVFLMLMVKAGDMMDDVMNSSISQLEALRDKYNAKQVSIQSLLNQLKETNVELEHLKSLESVDHTRLNALKKQLETLQIEYQKGILEAGKLQKDMRRVIQAEVAPRMQMMEAFSKTGDGMIYAYINQHANNKI